MSSKRWVPPCPAVAIAFMGILSLALGSCSESSRSDPSRFEITTTDGVRTVVSTGGPRYEEELFEYEHILTLDQDPAVEEALLTRPTSFVMDGSGHYHVLDQRGCRIAEFRPDGSYLRSYGRQGSGPGEFRTPRLVGMFDDVLTIFDMSFQRTLRFGQGGQLLSMRAVPPERGTWLYAYDLPDHDRQLLVKLGDSPEFGRVQLLIVDGSSQAVATVLTPPVRTRIRRSDESSPTSAPALLSVPYKPVPTAIYIPERGVLVSPADRPVLEWYDLQGRLTERIRVEGIPVEVTEAHQRHFDEEWDWRISTAPTETARSRNRAWKEALNLPDRLPWWTYVAMDDAGFYWLRVSEEIDSMEAPERGYLWRVLSPEGEYLGTTRTPLEQWAEDWQQHTLAISVREGRLMSIRENPETGGRDLRVYRIQAVAPGFSYPGRGRLEPGP